MQILFLFTIKIFTFCSLFLLFIKFGKSVLLNILNINIYKFSYRGEILYKTSSLSYRVCESRDQNSLRLSSISKIYIFVNLLTKYSKFEQSIWKFVTNKLDSNFIKYLLFKSINFSNLILFKLFNKI